jgi:hypothetical protein
MRLDSRRSVAAVTAVIAATMLGLGGCRARGPGSAADSARSGARTDTLPAPGAAAPSARADSVVLRTDKSAYRAGEKMTLTFENRSARSYAFNPCTRTLEREENGTWTALPDEGRMCTMEAWILDANGTRTGTTELPTPLPAGRYRVVVRMTVETVGGSTAPPINAVSDPITVS